MSNKWIILIGALFLLMVTAISLLKPENDGGWQETYNLAQAAIRNNDYDSAHEKLNRALKIAKKLNTSDARTPKTLASKGQIYLRQFDLPNAESNLLSAITQYTTQTIQPHEIFQLYIDWGDSYYLQGKSQAANVAYQQALQTAQLINPQSKLSTIALTRNCLSKLPAAQPEQSYYFGNSEQIKEQRTEQLKRLKNDIVQLEKDLTTLPENSDEFALACSVLGRYYASSDSEVAAVKHLKPLDNYAKTKATQFNIERMITLKNTGDSYAELGYTAKSGIFYDELLESRNMVIKKLNSKNIQLLTEILTMYAGDTDTHVENYTRYLINLLNKHPRYQIDSTLSEVLNDLGASYYRQKKYDIAAPLFEKLSAVKNEDHYYGTNPTTYLVQIYYIQQKWDKLIEQIKNVEEDRLTYSTYPLLWIAHQRLKNPHNAKKSINSSLLKANLAQNESFYKDALNWQTIILKYLNDQHNEIQLMAEARNAKDKSDYRDGTNARLASAYYYMAIKRLIAAKDAPDKEIKAEIIALLQKSTTQRYPIFEKVLASSELEKLGVKQESDDNEFFLN